MTPCGEFLQATDIQGAVVSSVGGTADNQACLDACLGFAGGCNAAIRINADGGCFFKSVDAATVGTDAFAIGTAYLVCPDGVTPGGGTGGNGTGGGGTTPIGGGGTTPIGGGTGGGDGGSTTAGGGTLLTLLTTSFMNNFALCVV